MNLGTYSKQISEEVKHLLSLAKVAAENRGSKTIASDHILLAMVFNKETRVCQILESCKATRVQIDIGYELIQLEEPFPIKANEDFQLDCMIVIEEAIRIAEIWNHELSGIHLLMSILDNRNKDSKASLLLDNIEVNKIELARKVINNLKLTKTKPEPSPLIVEQEHSRPDQEFESSFAQVEKSTETVAAWRIPEASEESESSSQSDSFLFEGSGQIGCWFTEKTQEVIAESYSIAISYNTKFITDAHLFDALINHKNLRSIRILDELVELEILRAHFYEGRNMDWNLTQGKLESPFSYHTHSTLTKAREIASAINLPRITPDILVIAILSQDKRKRVLSAPENVIPPSSSLAQTLIDRLKEPIEVDEAEITEPKGKDLEPDPESVLISVRVAKVLHGANHEAKKRNHPQISINHLVVSLIQSAMEANITFIKQREENIRNTLGMITTNTDQLKFETTSKEKDLPRLRDKAPSVPEKIVEILVDASNLARSLKSNDICLNHLAIAILKSLPEELEKILLANNLKANVLARRLQTCSIWHAFNDELSPQSVVLHLDRIETYFKENVLAAKRYDESVILNLLSERSRLIISQAIQRKEPRPIGIEDFVIGITLCPFLTAAEALENVGINYEIIKFENRLIPRLGSIRCTAGQKLSYNSLRLLKISWEVAKEHNAIVIEPEHILLAIAKEHKGIANSVVESLDISAEDLETEVLKSIA